MSISTLALYDQGLRRSYWRERIGKDSIAAPSGRIADLWATAPFAGATPTTAITLDNTTLGSFQQPDAPSGSGYIARVVLRGAAAINYMVVDRLVHSGGMSGTVTTEQTTNLPSGTTPALTRETSGVGVWMGVVIWSAIGASGTGTSIRYTNSAGTANRNTPNTVIGGTNAQEAGRIIVFPLQAGDVGVKSIQGVTQNATTSTVGNYGVILFRPKLFMSTSQAWADRHVFDGVRQLGGVLPQVANGACLSLMGIGGSTSTGDTEMQVQLING